MSNALQTYDIDVEDVEYIRHGDKPLLARMFKPRGTGPFRLIVELHGGKLRVDSTMNRGSAFAFNLPIHDFAQS